MPNTQEMAGNYHQYKGKIKERFGEFTDDEFEKASGSLEQLIGMIQTKSGEARRTIESYLQETFNGASHAAGAMANNAREYAGQAGEAIREGYDRVAAGVQEGYDTARSTVKERPVESLAVALGAGLLVGAILGLLISARSK